FLKTLSQVVLVPAWFLAAYLAVVALSPWTYALHKRHGWTALGAMAALAVAVDVASRFGGVPFLGWSTYVFVWAAVHQVGYFWRDGRLPRTVPGRLALAAAGYAALATLVFVAGYPLGMVGANGAGVAETQTNTTPPSIALAALAIGQLGLLLAIEGPATRWLERPRAWAAVALVGSSIMTVYLWHMSAMVAVAAAVLPGAWWPKAASLDATYWALRPVWLLFLLAVLALLVLAFRRFERAPTPRAAGASVGAGLVAALGVVLTGAGMAATVLGGLHAPSMPLGIPLVPLGLVLAGLAALGVLRSQKTHAASDGAATTEGR
ncbi:MAG TPA: acyltransferase family protein, partial [Candidatus Thermoplasmatota archaeon]|nr:acyltransferase family protein [Candidatus Thermoplasmatota archaeon]